MTRDLEQFERWQWLRWAVEKAPVWALTDGQLLDRVTIGLRGQERALVLGELERRMRDWSTSARERIAERLAALEAEHRRPGASAQDVDRLLQRLLRKLDEAAARRLADTCAKSTRLGRRRAAWMFYRAHGCGSEGALGVVSAVNAGERHADLIHLAASDKAVLSRLDASGLLSQIPEFYWRGRAVMVLLEGYDGSAAPGLIDQYPGEVLFALRRLNRSDLVDLVHQALRTHPENPDVVSNAIVAFATFSRTEDLRKTANRGAELLRAEDTRRLESRRE